MEIICEICAIFGTGILAGIILMVWVLKTMTQEKPAGCVIGLDGLFLLMCYILALLSIYGAR